MDHSEKRKRVVPREIKRVSHNSAEEDHLHYHGVDKAEEHISVEEALFKFLKEILPTTSEIVGIEESLGRVLSEDVRARFDVPLFDRASRDGYALKLSKAIPSGSEFNVFGEVSIGKKPGISIKGTDNDAVLVATGSFIPAGSNSVVMKEYVEVRGKKLRVTREVRIGENIVRKGDDIEKHSIALSGGTSIKPHNVALLAMIGALRVKVFRKPEVAFLSTGDELQDVSDAKPKKDDEKTNDINRPYIESMIKEIGAVPIDLGIAKDDYGAIKRKIQRGLESDVLIISAGSSVGERDYAARAAESISGLKMLVHGIAMRPSSPTGLGIYKGKPLIMLPGFPTSMITSFFVFCRPAILRRGGSTSTAIPMVKSRLVGGDYHGRRGLTQFLRMRVTGKNGEYDARIIRPTEAQYSSWLREANGFGVVDSSKSEVKDGDIIPVFLIGDLKNE